MGKKVVNVAVDGPAGAGKSSVSREAARKLGYVYVDTGALYRAVGVYALRKNVDVKNGAAVAEALKSLSLDVVFRDGEQRVLINGEDVSEDIRTPEASMAASDVSAVTEVREFLLNLQRDVAAKNDCIMEGRDIGTVVLPNADVKIFLTASVGERAARRYGELVAKGKDVDFKDVLDDMIKRDYQDSHRKIAPLKPAEDGAELDSSGSSVSESADKMIKIIREKI